MHVDPLATSHLTAYMTGTSIPFYRRDFVGDWLITLYSSTNQIRSDRVSGNLGFRNPRLPETFDLREPKPRDPEIPGLCLRGPLFHSCCLRRDRSTGTEMVRYLHFFHTVGNFHLKKEKS